MKKRASIVSGLAALAALFFAPLAEASLTRSSAPAREASAPALTLAAPEPSEFSLFDGTEIARALASRPAFDLISITTDDAATAVRTQFVSPSELSADELPEGPELVPITSVREQRFNLQIPPNVFGLEPLRGPPGDQASYPKTHYRVFGLLGTPIIGELRGVSLELHWGSGEFSCGLTSGTVGWLTTDPAGEVDSVNLYGYVGLRPQMATDPLGTCLLLFGGEPCSATAARADRALDTVKGALRIGAKSDAGAVVEAVTDTVIDAAKLFFVDPLRAGDATGTAIGSGAGAGETAIAVVQDVGRASALAAGAGAVVKVAGRGAASIRSLTRVGNELGEAHSGLTKAAAEGTLELAPKVPAAPRGRFPENAVSGTAREQAAIAEISPTPGQVLKQRTIYDEGGRALFQGKGRRLDAVRVEEGVVTEAFEITSPGEALRARKIRQIFRGDELISREGSYVLGSNGEKIPFAAGLKTTVITRP